MLSEVQRLLCTPDIDVLYVPMPKKHLACTSQKGLPATFVIVLAYLAVLTLFLTSTGANLTTLKTGLPYGLTLLFTSGCCIRCSEAVTSVAGGTSFSAPTQWCSSSVSCGITWLTGAAIYGCWIRNSLRQKPRFARLSRSWISYRYCSEGQMCFRPPSRTLWAHLP